MSDVVLLHAFPLDHRMWDPVADSIAAAGWNVFTPDIRGCGQAPGWAGKSANLSQCVDDVLDILNRFGIDKAVVGGCSLGGYIALEMLRRAPERVAGLMLMNTKASVDNPEVREQRIRISETVERAGSTEVLWHAMFDKVVGETTRATRSEVVARVQELMAQSRVDGVVNLQQAMADRQDTHAALTEFRGPVLSLRGSEDEVATLSDFDSINKSARDIVAIELENVGHLAPIEAPDDVARVVIDFLTRLKRVSC